MTDIATRAEQAKPDEARGLLENALRLLLNYVRKSRQGYVLIPLADRCQVMQQCGCGGRR